MFKAGIRQLAV